MITTSLIPFLLITADPIPENPKMTLIAKCTWQKTEETKYFNLYADEAILKEKIGTFTGSVSRSSKEKKAEGHLLLKVEVERSREDTYFRFCDNGEYFDVQLRPSLEAYSIGNSKCNTDEMLLTELGDKFSCKKAVEFPNFPGGGDD